MRNVRKAIAGMAILIAAVVVNGSGSGAAPLCAGHGAIVGASSITDSSGHTETRVYCEDGYTHIFT